MKSNIVTIIFVLIVFFGCAKKNKIEILSENIENTVLLAETIVDDICYIDTLTQSTSYFENDTLIVLIGDSKKTNFCLRIEVFRDNYMAFTEFSSDYPQYNGKYTKKYIANLNKFLLSEYKYTKGSKIRGKLETSSLSVSNYGGIKSISYKGQFVAIIE